MEVLGCGYTLMCGNICATDVHLCCITGYLYFVQNLHCSKPPSGDETQVRKGFSILGNSREAGSGVHWSSNTRWKCIIMYWTENQTLPISNSDGLALKLLFKGEAARGGSGFKEVGPWSPTIWLVPAPPFSIVGQRQGVPGGGDVGPCNQHVRQGGHILEGLWVVPAVGHLENLGLVVVVALCEEQDISVERVDCHSFTIISVVGILDVDVLDFLWADHYVVPVPLDRHFRLLELINGEGGPECKECVNPERWRKKARKARRCDSYLKSETDTHPLTDTLTEVGAILGDAVASRK